jgi:hypothetical protein
VRRLLEREVDCNRIEEGIQYVRKGEGGVCMRPVKLREVGI